MTLQISHSIISENNITWPTNVEEGQKMTSAAGSITVEKDVEKNAVVTAHSFLKIHGNSGEGSCLTSKTGSVNANDLADRVTVKAKDGVKVKNVGEHVILESADYYTTVEDTGSHCQIKSKRMVRANNIGPSSTIFAEWDGIRANHVGDDSTLSTEHGDIRVKSLGERVRILKSAGDIVVETPIPDSVFIAKPRYGNIQLPGQREQYYHEITPEIIAQRNALLNAQRTGQTIHITQSVPANTKIDELVSTVTAVESNERKED